MQTKDESNKPHLKEVSAQGARQDQWSVLLTQVGDERCKQAFSQLFAHFAPLLKGFCVANANHSLPAELADEIVQEVMLKVWSKAPSFDATKSAATTWIYTVMRNSRIDMVRRNSKHNQVTETIEADDIWDETPEHQPFIRLDRARKESTIKEAFSQLPLEQRDVLVKVYMHGKSHREIAAESGLPLGTVKSRIRMGMKKVQSCLGQFRGES